jgi:hypothetical protein
MTVLTVVTIAVVLDAAVLVYLFIIGDLSNISFLLSGLLCLFFALYFFKGLKNVNEELQKRED